MNAHWNRRTNIDAGLISSMVALCAVRTEAWANDPPATIELTGVVRDFNERTHAAGHPDFEKKPSAGFGLYCGNVAAELGEDGKPVFTGDGYKVQTKWKDEDNRPIAPHLCNKRYVDGELVDDAELDDQPGAAGVSNTGGVASADSFAQWFRDEMGINLSRPLTLTLVRQEDGSYVFDDKEDPAYSANGGFFPIDDEMLGNPGGTPDHNFHFTFELHTNFTYDASAGQVFRFVGDDDVWVFIDGKLAIDLGGVHGATEQVISLDRMGLEDGKAYSLDFFFAERHRTQSNFRIATNLVLETAGPCLPTMTMAFD